MIKTTVLRNMKRLKYLNLLTTLKKTSRNVLILC